MEGATVVHRVPCRDGSPTLETLLVGLGPAALAVRLSILLLDLPVLPDQGILAGGAHKAVHVVGLERKLYPLLGDGLCARLALWGHLLHVARGAHDAAGHLVELTIHQPGSADVALEAVGVPAPVAVLEVAHTGTDPLLAALALPNRFGAVGADDVVVDHKVAPSDQIFPAALANEALPVIMLPLYRQLLLVEADGLVAPVALGGILPVAAFAEDSPLVGSGGLALHCVIAIKAAKVLLVPVLSSCFREIAGENNLSRKIITERQMEEVIT